MKTLTTVLTTKKLPTFQVLPTVAQHAMLATILPETAAVVCQLLKTVISLLHHQFSAEVLPVIVVLLVSENLPTAKNASLASTTVKMKRLLPTLIIS